MNRLISNQNCRARYDADACHALQVMVGTNDDDNDFRQRSHARSTPNYIAKVNAKQTKTYKEVQKKRNKYGTLHMLRARTKGSETTHSNEKNEIYIYCPVE